MAACAVALQQYSHTAYGDQPECDGGHDRQVPGVPAQRRQPAAGSGWFIRSDRPARPTTAAPPIGAHGWPLRPDAPVVLPDPADIAPTSRTLGQK